MAFIVGLLLGGGQLFFNAATVARIGRARKNKIILTIRKHADSVAGMNEQTHPGLEAAIAKAGGPRKLAELIGAKSPQVVYGWRKLRVGIPAEWAPIVAKKTGISKARLRPDLWGKQ